MKPYFEVADVILLHGESFRKNHQLTGQVLRTLNAIEQCRTSESGGHVDVCDACAHLRISYNKGKFLFPVKAMSKVFRAKFVSKLREWAKEEKQDITQQLFDKLFQKPWVVYAKQPFGGPKQVVEYLGRYTHKIAISNHRLLNVRKHGITFTWKDYRHGNSKKQMQLSGEEFLRRFSQHILPHGFMRIRHYGMLSSRSKAEKLQQARSDLKTEAPPKPNLNWKAIALQRLNFNPDQCPHCKKGQMITLLQFDGCNGPPNNHLLQKLKKTMKPK